MKASQPEICIRDIGRADADAYFEIFSDPKVAEFDDFTPITHDELLADMERIAKYTCDSLNREFAVAVMPSNEMVGVLTLDMKRKFCYLGYHFSTKHHGKGLAATGVGLFLQQLPSHVLSVLRVVSDPLNLPSVKLAQKVGFVHVANRVLKGKREMVFDYKPEGTVFGHAHRHVASMVG
jgi:RimJ/RimL family protein N-acetyltransferase